MFLRDFKHVHLLALITAFLAFSPAYAQTPEEPLRITLSAENETQNIEVETLVVQSPTSLRRAIDWIKGRLPKTSSRNLIVLGLRERHRDTESARDAVLAANEFSKALDTKIVRENIREKDLLNADANELGVEDLKGLTGRRYLLYLTVSRMVLSGVVGGAAVSTNIIGTAITIRPDFTWAGALSAGVLAAALPGFYTFKGPMLRDWFAAERISKVLDVTNPKSRAVLNRIEQLLKGYAVSFTAGNLFRTVEQLTSHVGKLGVVQSLKNLSLIQNLKDVAITSVYDTASFWPWETYFTHYEQRNFRAIEGQTQLSPKQRELARFYVRRRIDTANWAVGLVSTGVAVLTLAGNPKASIGFGIIGATGVIVNVWDIIQNAKQSRRARLGCAALIMN